SQRYRTKKFRGERSSCRNAPTSTATTIWHLLRTGILLKADIEMRRQDSRRGGACRTANEIIFRFHSARATRTAPPSRFVLTASPHLPNSFNIGALLGS